MIFDMEQSLSGQESTPTFTGYWVWGRGPAITLPTQETKVAIKGRSTTTIRLQGTKSGVIYSSPGGY